MANRKDYYFRQKVTEAELDDGFDHLEDADRNLMSDMGLVGVVSNAQVVEAAVPDLTIDAAGPAIIYDQQGRRINWSPTQNVDCSQDENAITTAVVGGANEKYLSIFAQFDRLLSDPRTDGNSLTVFFERSESFKINVVQGAEAPLGTAVKPALRADEILLADVLLIFGQTQIFNADIDPAGVTRREDAFILDTASFPEIRKGRVEETLQALYDQLENHKTTDGHDATAVDYAGGPNWNSGAGAANPATTAEAQFDKIITDLSSEVAGSDGILRLGMEAIEASEIGALGGTDQIIGNGNLRSGMLDMAGNMGPLGTWRFTAFDIADAFANAAWSVASNGHVTTTTDGSKIRFSFGQMFKNAGGSGPYVIHNVRAYVQDNAASTIGIELFAAHAKTTAGPVSKIGVVQSNGGGAAQTLTLVGSNLIDPGADRVFFIEFNTSGGGVGLRQLFGFEVDFGYFQ